MRVVVEFTGVARMLTGQSSVDLELAPDDTLQQVVISLARQFPALIAKYLKKAAKA